MTSTGSFNNTHRFTGKEYEASGIYYFGARYYDPTLGRFLTPDPLGKFELKDPMTINPYVYCTNNPLRYVDPTGKWRTAAERYAWPVTSEFATREFVSGFGPGVGLANCIVRSSTGDVTLSTKDWIWGGVGVATLAIPAIKVADPLYKSLLRGLDWSISLISAMESGVFSEVRQDKIIWKIAGKMGIVSADGTIDLEAMEGEVGEKFRKINKFVKDIDKNYGELSEEYQKDYEEWYDIYKEETP